MVLGDIAGFGLIGDHSEQEKLNQGWFNAGPPSATLAQH